MSLGVCTFQPAPVTAHHSPLATLTPHPSPLSPLALAELCGGGVTDSGVAELSVLFELRTLNVSQVNVTRFIPL